MLLRSKFKVSFCAPWFSSVCRCVRLNKEHRCVDVPMKDGRQPMVRATSAILIGQHFPYACIHCQVTAVSRVIYLSPSYVSMKRGRSHRACRQRCHYRRSAYACDGRRFWAQYSDMCSTRYYYACSRSAVRCRTRVFIVRSLHFLAWYTFLHHASQ